MKSFSNQGYEEEAHALVEHYERISFEDAHRHVLEFFPKNPAQIIDIGSGTGRDAAFLASQGHLWRRRVITLWLLNQPMRCAMQP